MKCGYQIDGGEYGLIDGHAGEEARSADGIEVCKEHLREGQVAGLVVRGRLAEISEQAHGQIGHRLVIFQKPRFLVREGGMEGQGQAQNLDPFERGRLGGRDHSAISTPMALLSQSPFPGALP